MENELVIRTMKDDIADINTPKQVAPLPVPKTKHEKPAPPIFTLPADKLPPFAGGMATSEKNTKYILKGAIYFILFCALSSGLYYGYTQWDTIQIQNSSSQEASFFQLIPKEASALVRYNIDSVENRNIVNKMWSDARGEADGSAIHGDPTSLLQISDISQVYYLVLPSIQTPFLLLEKTEGTKQYVSQYSKEQTTETANWYVVHANNIEDYTSALEAGTIAEDSPLLAVSDRSSYVIRYAISGEFASRQFTSATATASGLSKVNTLIFHIGGISDDDTIRASALIAGDPPGEGVVEGTTELLSLVPSDITFGRIGFNLVEDIAHIQEDSAQFDGTVLAQPAVRLFISLFKTPYAIFERKGSDGVSDIGLIMALPGSLKRKIATGEEIIEQSLPALIPLVIGKALGIQVAFNDGVFSGAPIRYVNLIGQTQTLDYTVGDNFLLISSSREGMEALVDTSLGNKKGLSIDEPWAGLLGKAADSIKDRMFIVGSLTDPAIISVLPVASTMTQVPVIASSGRTSTGIDIQVVLPTK